LVKSRRLRLDRYVYIFGDKEMHTRKTRGYRQLGRLRRRKDDTEMNVMKIGCKTLRKCGTRTVFGVLRKGWLSAISQVEFSSSAIGVS